MTNGGVRKSRCYRTVRQWRPRLAFICAVLAMPAASRADSAGVVGLGLRAENGLSIRRDSVFLMELRGGYRWGDVAAGAEFWGGPDTGDEGCAMKLPCTASYEAVGGWIEVRHASGRIAPYARLATGVQWYDHAPAYGVARSDLGVEFLWRHVGVGPVGALGVSAGHNGWTYSIGLSCNFYVGGTSF
jgi:hypothetical protein